jgi:hypothetical protein
LYLANNLLKREVSPESAGKAVISFYSPSDHTHFTYERLTHPTLFGLGQLVSTSLLKIDHIVITHLVTRAMLTQYPARKLDAKSLYHVYLLRIIVKCNRKYGFLLMAAQKRGRKRYRAFVREGKY